MLLPFSCKTPNIFSILHKNKRGVFAAAGAAGAFFPVFSAFSRMRREKTARKKKNLFSCTAAAGEEKEVVSDHLIWKTRKIRKRENPKSAVQKGEENGVLFAFSLE